MPENPTNLELQVAQVKEKIKIWDLKDIDISKVSTLLDTPEANDAFKKTIDQTYATEVMTRIEQKPALTESDRSIMRLFAILHPELAINARLEATSKPSWKITAVLNGDGGALNFEEFKKLTNEQIQELFRNINKWDLLALARSIPDTKPDPIDPASFDLLKSSISATLNSMIQSGISISSEEDIQMIERYSSAESKATLIEFRKIFGEKPFDSGKKYHMQWARIEPLTTADGKLTKGIDISKINTLDIKASAEQMKKQLGWSFDKTQFAETISKFLKSDLKVFKWLSEFLKIFATLLGIDFGDNNDASKEKPLEAKQKRELLMKMGKANESYDVSTFFDPVGWLSTEVKDPKFQLYLADIDKIIGPNAVKKAEDGKTFLFDDVLKEKIKGYQTALKMPSPTGRLDTVSIAVMLTRLDAEGKIIDAPQVAPAKAPEPLRDTAPAVTEAPKHRFSPLYEKLSSKASFEEIKSDPELRKMIQELVDVTEDGYWPLTRAAVKKFQITELGMQKINRLQANFADGFFGPKTLKLMKAKIDKEKPPEKK